MPSFSATSLASQRHVAFVLFDQTKLIDVTGPLQAFNDAELLTGEKAYRVSLVSEAGGPVVTDTGFGQHAPARDVFLSGRWAKRSGSVIEPPELCVGVIGEFSSDDRPLSGEEQQFEILRQVANFVRCQQGARYMLLAIGDAGLLGI